MKYSNSNIADYCLAQVLAKSNRTESPQAIASPLLSKFENLLVPLAMYYP
ncbi:hypothetical protein LC593_36020 [Nostoc sp. CHAB 5844]|nr:hypothetical protein [Nostoc sp. CHAB 5844]